MYSSNPKTERYLESIKRLESQINWNQIKTVLLDLMGIIFVFGFFYSASLFFKIKLLKILAIIFSLLALLCLTIKRRTTNGTAIGAAKKLDSHFKTKELFLSLYEVCNSSKDLPPERKKELSNIITKQITKQIGLKVIDETEIEPLKLSKKRKRLLLFFYPLTALASAFLLYKVITTITVEQKFIASIKSIANQAVLTEKQKEKTEDLVNTLAENPLTSQEVSSAVSDLEVALNENQTKEMQDENRPGKESARDNKNSDKNQSQNNKENSVANSTVDSSTVATATPTATATLTPTSEINNKQKESKQNQEKKEDQKIDVQNSKPDKSNQEKSPQDKKSGGAGEGEGNQSNGKQPKDGGGEKSDSKQGQGKQQSEDQKNNGGGGDNSKNPQKESQKDQQKASSGSSSTGSDKLKNKLDELKKEISKQQDEQSGSDKGSKGVKQQDKKDDKGEPKNQGKDSQNDGNQGNKKGDNQSQQESGADGKSGQAQQQKDDKGKGDKSESKSNDSQSNQSIPNDQSKQQDKSSPAVEGQNKDSNPSGKQSDKQKDNPQEKSTDKDMDKKEIDKNDDKNKQSNNSAAGAKGMSLPGDSVKTEEKIPQDGGNGEKSGVKTGFQDKNIENNEKEKLNLDSLDNKSGEVTKNQNPAKPKTDIKDLLLSKPETSNNKEKQRVPLEYKGIL